MRQRSASPAAAAAAGGGAGHAKVDDVQGVAELLEVGGLSSREVDELRSLLLLHSFAEEVEKQGPGLTNRKGKLDTLENMLHRTSTACGESRDDGHVCMCLFDSSNFCASGSACVVNAVSCSPFKGCGVDSVLHASTTLIYSICSNDAL
jgi:hypothetical protein